MLTALTAYAFASAGPVQRVLGQHRPAQAAMAHEFATFIEQHRALNHTTVSLNEQRGGLGKTATYVIVLLLDIALTGQRAAYATFTRALRDSIKDQEPQYNQIVGDTLRANGIAQRTLKIAQFQSPTAFVSPRKCEAIRRRLAAGRIPAADVPEVQEFLHYVAACEPPCEFADLYGLLPNLPCGFTESSLALCQQDRDTEDWQIVQRRRDDASDRRTLVLLTHAMVIRSNLRRSRLFQGVADIEEEAFQVKNLVIDEADKLPAVANAALRVVVSRNDIADILAEVQTNLDRRSRAAGEQILTQGLKDFANVFSRVNYSCGKDDPAAIQISAICARIIYGFNALFSVAVTHDALIADRIRLCRDNIAVLAQLHAFDHPVLQVALGHDPLGQPDIILTLEMGGGRRLISQMWRSPQHSFETITMASAMMTNMPPYASRYDRFRRDIDLDRAKGDHVIERPPLQPAYGRIDHVVVADRLPSLLPTDLDEATLLRQSSLDGVAAQIATAARQQQTNERMVVLFQSYVAMEEVLNRLPTTVQTRVVMRHRRHLSSAIEDFGARPLGIWFGVEWEGINFVHPITRRTMVDRLIITRMPLAPRDEIRATRLNLLLDNSVADSAVLREAVHAAYRKLYHGLLLGIRNEHDVIGELWILDPRWPLPASVYQQQPPQIIRAIGGGLFNYFDRIIDHYTIARWSKVDADGRMTSLIRN